MSLTLLFFKEDSLIQAENSCTQLVGSCCKLLEMNCHGLEGMVALEGHGEGMLVLMGHQDVEMERLRAEHSGLRRSWTSSSLGHSPGLAAPDLCESRSC